MMEEAVKTCQGMWDSLHVKVNIPVAATGSLQWEFLQNVLSMIPEICMDKIGIIS